MTLATKTGQVKFQPKGDLPPLIYPAGVYSPDVTYERTNLVAPMVLCETQYYVLNKDGSFKGINPKTDYAANGKKATWILMDKFQYAFIEMLMVNFAKLASAVFYGDYMFSQQGVDASGNTTFDYHKFGTDAFTPNLMFNFMTGEIVGGSCDLSGSIRRGIVAYESGTLFQITAKSNIYVIKNSQAQNKVYLFFSSGAKSLGTELCVINGGSGVTTVSYLLENPFFLFKGKLYSYIKLNKPGDSIELIYSPILTSLSPNTGGAAFIIRNKSDFRAATDGVTLESI